MDSSLVESFFKLWSSSPSPPDVAAFLQRHPQAKAAEKLQVLLIDQQRRWQMGIPWRVEEYLTRIAEVADSSLVRLELVVGECRCNPSAEETEASVSEITARFPELAPAIRTRLAMTTGIAESADNYLPAAEVIKPLTTTLAPGLLPDQNTEIRLGRYRLVRLLGEGAFGRVWLANDDELRRSVAIKVPLPERFRTSADAEQYLEEARTLAGLRHPHIVPVYDVGRTEEGAIYVVSDFIEGETLQDELRRARPSRERTVAVLSAIAEALQHAHNQKLIHRDVKPSNILSERATGRAFLADFGLAIREEASLRSAIGGTPAYMSPEQARGGGHRLDGRSDLFSLGVVLYQMLTGKRPFAAERMTDLLQQIITIDPLPPRELDANIPPELERICLKLLSKRASDRHATGGELAADLNRWYEITTTVVTDQPVENHNPHCALDSFTAEVGDSFLVLCPKCTRKISTAAAACPQCGHPNQSAPSNNTVPTCYSCQQPATTRCQCCHKLSCGIHLRGIGVNSLGSPVLRCDECYDSFVSWNTGFSLVVAPLIAVPFFLVIAAFVVCFCGCFSFVFR